LSTALIVRDLFFLRFDQSSTGQALRRSLAELVAPVSGRAFEIWLDGVTRFDFMTIPSRQAAAFI
jgi:hypothetical protein